MAIPLVYESGTIEYLPIDTSIDWPQNEWLNEPPREWGEAISRDGAFLALEAIRPFVVHKPTRNYPVATYGMTLIVAAQRASLIRVYMQFFDPLTGELLSKYSGSKVATLQVNHLAAGRIDGAIWASSVPSNVEKVFVDLEEWSPTGVVYHPASFTPAGTAIGCVDEINDLYICSVSGVDLDVYRLSTGIFLYRIATGSPVRHVMFEDERRCFAVCDDGIIILVDYVNRRVLGVIRIDLIGNQEIGDVGFAWDPFSRRLLTCEKSLDEAVTGAPTTIMRGYFPIAQAVRVTTPIPLEVPRKGRRIRILTRVHGSTGEPIGGKTVTATESGQGTLRSSTASTDAEGYATHHLVCDNSGSSTVTVSAQTT